MLNCFEENLPGYNIPMITGYDSSKKNDESEYISSHIINLGEELPYNRRRSTLINIGINRILMFGGQYVFKNVDPENGNKNYSI